MGFGSSNQQSTNNSQQTSEAKNQAYPFLQGALGTTVTGASQGSTAVGNLLGLNGSDNQDAGFQKFKDSSGYNFIQQQGVDGITGNAAAKGSLGSGSTLKALSSYSSGLASSFLDKYLSQLMSLSNNGLQAGSILAGAGNTSTGQGTSSGNSKGSSFNVSSG
jgi:hypothetical protein